MAWLKHGLVKAFNKDVFTEEEIQNKEFYTILRLNCNECFITEDGSFNLDLFWSEYTRDVIIGKISI